MAKMVRTTCAFCSEGEAGSVMYIATERNIAAHQDCLLFSSGFVESEDHNPENLEIRFDVSSVLKELRRGKRLACSFCRKKGATVGCEERTCRRSYHFFCALCDDAAVETDEVNGVYRVFCPKHDPGNRTNRYDAANKKRRRTLTSPTITEEMSTEETAEENSLRILKRKNDRHKVRIDFVRKCKQAGLLDDIFEEMLDTLHLAQEKLMDDNTSEREYEETVMALFDCGLFENILTNIYSAHFRYEVEGSQSVSCHPFLWKSFPSPTSSLGYFYFCHILFVGSQHLRTEVPRHRDHPWGARESWNVARSVWLDFDPTQEMTPV